MTVPQMTYEAADTHARNHYTVVVANGGSQRRAEDAYRIAMIACGYVGVVPEPAPKPKRKGKGQTRLNDWETVL